MPSTPSPLLRIQLMGTGDQAGTWGDTTNTNLGTLLEGSIAGLASVLVTSANQALVATDYVADQARMAIISLSISGAVTTAFNVYAPPVSKTYVIQNTSIYDATIYNATVAGGTTAAGSGVTVPAGGVAYVFSNGTNCFSLNSLYGGSTASLLVNSSGNLNIVGSARRIIGDFSNATIASRVIFQTSTTNGATSVSAIPNGTGTDVNFAVWNNPDTANGSVGTIAASTTNVNISSTKTGTGTYLPLTLNTSDQERVRVDTSGNVGIGATSPGSFDSAWQKLIIGGGSGDVGQTIYSGSSSIGTMAFADGISGAQQYAGLIRYLHASDAMTFWANATERMRITSAGDVGIGTSGLVGTSPVTSLTIYKATAAANPIGSTLNPALRLITDASEFDEKAEIQFAAGTAASSGEVFAALSSLYTVFNAVGDTGGALLFSTRQSTAAGGLTERMRITSAGDVGIGTSTPTYSLEIDKASGSFRVRDATGGNDVAIRSVAGPVSLIGSTSNTPIGFTTNNIERTRIAADGSQSSVIPSGSTLYPQFACRAWINFDGTSGSIGTGRGSGNVSSVTDNGTGDYTINFTTAMPDTNYSVTGVAKEFDATTFTTVVFYLGKNQTYANTYSTSSVRVNAASPGSGTNTDAFAMNVAIFR